MTEKQQDLFTSVTWERDDPIVIGDRAGKFRMFSPNADKFMVEFPDLDQGGVDRRWFDIDELPKKNLPALPEEADDKDVVPTGIHDTPTVDLLDEAYTGESSAEAEGDTETDAPLHVPAGDEEIVFEEGHKRVLETGSKLVVEKPSVRGKYMCRIFLSLGGTTVKEMSWQDIAQWGKPVKPGDDKPVPIEDVVKAVHEKMTEELSDTPPAPPEEVDTVPQPEADVVAETEDEADDCIGEPVKMVRERKIEHFVMRDEDGFHTAAASAKLNSIIADGYRLEHAEYCNQYRPTGGGYVDTIVVFWTFLRLREPIG